MPEKNKIRMREDRRNLEKGPPNGWRERRKSVERRLPEVEEVPFSEWLAHWTVKETVEQK